jgi:hypothetical protein
MSVRDVVQAAAGQGGDKLYVEDVFSTYLYTGNGSTQTITNGIDLDGEGGLVWVKWRSGGGLGSSNNALFDTVRGVNNIMYSDTTMEQQNTGTGSNASLSAFNNNGFSLGPDAMYGRVNYLNGLFASWTLRKSPKFFDVVTYTGNGANRTIAHNLGSVPGCIIVKRTDGSNPWAVYHRKSSPTVPEDKELQLNATDGAVNGFTTWNRTLPTDAVFSVGTEGKVNENGWQYVAYLFAHDAGGFGDDGEQNVISCGSFTTGAGGVSSVNLGYEPQFILFKNTVSSENWMLFDTFRGLPAPGTSTGRQQLKPNLADEEGSNNYASVTSTGFDTQNLYSSEAYIYIAIRRGPMKTPEAGTEVFAPSYFAGDGSTSRLLNVGFPTDLFLGKRAIGDPSAFVDRMRGKNKQLFTGGAYAENTGTDYCRFDSNSGPIIGYNSGGININSSAYSYRSYSFKRSSSFMDVLAYKGNSSSQDLAHNLNAIPELVMVKSRTSSYDWYVWATGFSSFQALKLNSDIAKASYGTIWGFASPPVTETTLSLGGDYYANSSSSDYSAYLFASCPNVSKVGTYVGNASSLNIDCGFSTGARLVLIKRIDATGDWYLWDSVRGISFSNDAFILLNSFDGENNSYNYISPLASGFTVRSTAPAALNASGGSYLFLAIA